MKNRVNKKSFQNFIWKNKTSPLLKTQEKDFQVIECALVVRVSSVFVCVGLGWAGLGLARLGGVDWSYEENIKPEIGTN